MTAELESGSTLGRYELLVRIGRGGMASVWVARERGGDNGNDRLVAVKAMLPDLALNSEFRSMFLEEGGIVGAIDHPNVVRVYEVAEDHGILYMGMEWVEGDSLRTVIREAQRRRAVPPEMGVRMIADAAAGLHAAHELRGWDGELRGIVHCDVSPHNILIGINGAAKLVDFGVARAMTYGGALEDGGAIRGKFAYMSPEQAAARSIDRRSDVFSLGVVLFELLTGIRLFKGRDKQHTLELVSWGKIPRPSELNPRLPRALEPIVMKALERDPQNRYQTADELRVALERWLVDERVLVSQAGVGQLVRRVLGTMIEKRRETIREALVAADGKLGVGLVSDQPISVEATTSDIDHDSVSVSMASVSTATSTDTDPWRVASSNSPSASSPTSTGTARPQTLAGRRSSRSSVLFIVGAMVGIAAGAGGVLYAIKGSSTAQASKVEEAASDKPAKRDDTTPAASVENGLSVDSLPLDEERRKAEEQRRRDQDPNHRRAEDDKRKKKGDKIQLEEEPERANAPEPEHMTLNEEADKAAAPLPPKPPAPAGAATAPLSQGAAIAALGAAAAGAPSCKKPGGPSGTGRATVTFAPNGTVSAVSLSSKFAGTPVGSCVEGLFRRARLDPFTGGPVTLGRSFEVPE